MKGILGKIGRRLWTELHSIYWEAVALPLRLVSFIANFKGEKQYCRLSEDDLKKKRKSDTVFIYGSGFSINAIKPEEWSRMAEHDTISFREFPRQNKIRADFHLTAEIDFIEEYARLINENPLYQKTVFVVQGGFRAICGNQLIGKALLRKGAEIFRFRRCSPRKIALPGGSFKKGIVHLFNSVSDTVNFAYLMGWKRIVLVGVDLNDKRYFWLPPDVLRAYEKKEVVDVNLAFPTLKGVLDFMKLWRKVLLEQGVVIEVWNPKSALVEVLPLYAGSVRIGNTDLSNSH